MSTSTTECHTDVVTTLSACESNALSIPPGEKDIVNNAIRTDQQNVAITLQMASNDSSSDSSDTEDETSNNAEIEYIREPDENEEDDQQFANPSGDVLIPVPEGMTVDGYTEVDMVSDSDNDADDEQLLVSPAKVETMQKTLKKVEDMQRYALLLGSAALIVAFVGVIIAIVALAV